MSVLETKNISCGYGTKEVIRDVSFEIPLGSFVAIIGPNGAGKTTLFRAITKLLSLTRGRVIYGGQDIRHISVRKFASEVATLPQFLEIPFSLSVEEFVLMGRFPHRGRFGSIRQKDVDIVRKAMELTDTLSLRGRRLLELSGGERQRVFLAQAFAQEPRLLLLDEPTAHLDITHQVRIMDIIRKLNREENLTVLVVLHDLNLASEYCDKLILLKNGAMYQQGQAKEVLTYQNIESVYNTVVVVEENPISKKPYILLVSEQERSKRC